jgi:fucose 4-O-acetylase-like acetyltransferase
MEGRQDWIDYAKGMGIIMVVYGHVLRGIHAADIQLSESFFAVSDTLIYGTHMPLFFFLSGLLFSKCLLKRGTSSFVRDKFKALLYPYVVWTLLQSATELIFSGYTNNQLHFSNLLTSLYIPRAQFWFLHALFMMYLCSAIIFVFSERYGAAISFMLSGFLYAFPQVVNLAFFGPFITNYVYFTSGIVCCSMGMGEWRLPTSRWFTLATGAAFVAIGALAVRQHTSGISLLGFLLALSGTLFILTLATRMSNANGPALLKMLGQKTMPIYLGHIIAGSGARIMLDKFFQMHDVTLHIIIGTVAGIVLPLWTYRIAKARGFTFVFEFPVATRGRLA